MPVLENVSGRLRTYTLTGAHLATHATHENRYRSHRRVTVHQSKAGELAVRATSVLLPDSLRLVTGEKREVESEVLHCPDVKAAIARGELRVAKESKKAEPEKHGKPDDGGGRERIPTRGDDASVHVDLLTTGVSS